MGSICENINKMLVDYADGELSTSDSSKVEEHLAKCEQCREMLKALQKSLELAEVICVDSFEETEGISILFPRKKKKVQWFRYAAVAAGILLIATTSLVWHALVRPTEREINFTEIERRINDSASAARLLAAVELLARYSEDKDLIKEQYRYIAETYPQTSEAAQARLKIK